MKKRAFVLISFFSLFLILFSSFAFAGVLINEVMPNPSSGSDWIEIYNNGSSDVNLTGWDITDNTGVIKTPDILILPYKHAVINASNRLNNGGDNLTLYDNTGSYIDEFNYTGSIADNSQGRMHDGLGKRVNFSADDVTKGSANNRKPAITSSPALSVNEDLNYTYQVNALDADNDSLAYLIAGPSWMTVNNTGYVFWQTDNSKVGKHNITIFASDGYFSANQSFTLNVTNANDEPVISNAGSEPKGGVEGIEYGFDFNAYDIDPTNDTLVFGLVSGHAGMNVNSSGYLSWIPEKGGIYYYNISVSDGKGGFDYYNSSINADYALDFRNINFKINGQSRTVSENEVVPIKLGDLLLIEAQIENNLQGNDRQIEDILFKAILLSSQKTASKFGLNSQEYKTKTLDFNMSYYATVGVYNLSLQLNGLDDYTLRKREVIIKLNITKETDKIVIENLNVSYKNLTCYRFSRLGMAIRNIGYAKQYQINASISSQFSSIPASTVFDLEEDGIAHFTFFINATNSNEGSYPVKININYEDGSLSYTENIKVNKCVNNFAVEEDNTPEWNNYDLAQDSNPQIEDVHFYIFNQSNSSLINCNINSYRYFSCGNPAENQHGENEITLKAVYPGIIPVLGSAYFKFKVFVIAANDAPVLSSLPDVAFNEDESYTLDLTNYIFDADGDKLYWSSNGRNVKVTFAGSNATFTATQNWNGTEEINITVSDGKATDSDVVLATVNPVDDASVINYYSPSFNPVLGVNEKMNFSVIASDADGQLNYNWLLGGLSAGAGSSYEFYSANAGIFNLTAAVDGASHEWRIRVVNAPIAETFDGATTNFNAVPNISAVENAVLEKTAYGKIEFNSTLDLSRVYELDNYATIGNVIAIDTAKYPQLNKPAVVTMKHQSYNDAPKVYYNPGFTTDKNAINLVCSFCRVLNYTSYPTTDGTVVFYAEHFSSFKIGYEKTYNYSKLERCISGEIGDVDASISEPEDDDEFDVEEQMEIEVDAENNADDDKDVRVEAVLYDADENEVVDSDDLTQEIDGEDSETYNVVLKAPAKADDRHKFVLFVKAYEKGEEDKQCSEDMIEVDITREEHKVIVKEFNLMPSSANCGQMIDAEVEIENIGDSDEDAKIIIENSELGIHEESLEYELEAYDEDDNDAAARLNFKIPDNAQAKEYTITAKAEYEDGSTTETTVLNIGSCGAKATAFTQAGISGAGAISGLSVLEENIEAKPGQSIAVPVKIRNDDEYSQVYSVLLENVNEFGNSLSGAKVVKVMPNSEAMEYMYLRVNNDADAGLHTASIKLSSGKGQSYKNININVAEDKGIMFLPKIESRGVYVLLILANIVLLLIVVWLFKIAVIRTRR